VPNQLIRFRTVSGVDVLVEVDDESGFQKVRADGVVADAKEKFDEALQTVNAAAESALGVFRSGSANPENIEIEFGIKLSAQAGAVIARTAVEGHLLVRLSWHPSSTPNAGRA
jgi:hypothetical protein